MEIQHTRKKATRVGIQEQSNGNTWVGAKQRDLGQWQQAPTNYKRELMDAVPDIAFVERRVVSNDVKRSMAAAVDQIGHISIMTPRIRNIAKLVSNNAVYLQETTLTLQTLSRMGNVDMLNVADDYAKVVVQGIGAEYKYNQTGYLQREKMQ